MAVIPGGVNPNLSKALYQQQMQQTAIDGFQKGMQLQETRRQFDLDQERMKWEFKMDEGLKIMYEGAKGHPAGLSGWISDQKLYFNELFSELGYTPESSENMYQAFKKEPLMLQELMQLWATHKAEKPAKFVKMTENMAGTKLQEDVAKTDVSMKTDTEETGTETKTEPEVKEEVVTETEGEMHIPTRRGGRPDEGPGINYGSMQKGTLQGSEQPKPPTYLRNDEQIAIDKAEEEWDKAEPGDVVGSVGGNKLILARVKGGSTIDPTAIIFSDPVSGMKYTGHEHTTKDGTKLYTITPQGERVGKDKPQTRTFFENDEGWYEQYFGDTSGMGPQVGAEVETIGTNNAEKVSVPGVSATPTRTPIVSGQSAAGAEGTLTLGTPAIEGEESFTERGTDITVEPADAQTYVANDLFQSQTMRDGRLFVKARGPNGDLLEFQRVNDDTYRTEDGKFWTLRQGNDNVALFTPRKSSIGPAISRTAEVATDLPPVTDTDRTKYDRSKETPTPTPEKFASYNAHKDAQKEYAQTGKTTETVTGAVASGVMTPEEVAASESVETMPNAPSTTAVGKIVSINEEARTNLSADIASGTFKKSTFDKYMKTHDTLISWTDWKEKTSTPEGRADIDETISVALRDPEFMQIFSMVTGQAAFMPSTLEPSEDGVLTVDDAKKMAETRKIRAEAAKIERENKQAEAVRVAAYNTFGHPDAVAINEAFIALEQKGADLNETQAKTVESANRAEVQGLLAAAWTALGTTPEVAQIISNDIKLMQEMLDNDPNAAGTPAYQRLEGNVEKRLLSVYGEDSAVAKYVRDTRKLYKWPIVGGIFEFAGGVLGVNPEANRYILEETSTYEPDTIVTDDNASKVKQTIGNELDASIEDLDR